MFSVCAIRADAFCDVSFYIRLTSTISIDVEHIFIAGWSASVPVSNKNIECPSQEIERRIFLSAGEGAKPGWL